MRQCSRSTTCGIHLAMSPATRGILQPTATKLAWIRPPREQTTARLPPNMLGDVEKYLRLCPHYHSIPSSQIYTLSFSSRWPMVNSASSDLSFARAQSGYILMYVPHFFALCKRRRLRRPVSSFLVETQEAFRTCTRSGGSGANGRVFGG